MKNKVESRKMSFYRYLCLLPADFLFQEIITCTSPKSGVRFK